MSTSEAIQLVQQAEATLAAAVAALQVTPGPTPTPTPAPAPTPSPSSWTQITSKNLRFRGLQLCTLQPDPNRKYTPPYLAGFDGALAVKQMADGSLHFLLVGPDPANFTPYTPGLANDGNTVIEMADAGFGLDLSNLPRATFVNAYSPSQFYGSVIPVTTAGPQMPGAAGYITPGSLLNVGGAIFWNFGPFYAVTAASDAYPCIGFSVQQPDGTWKAYGPYQTQVNSHDARGYLFLAPPDFAAQYLGGNQLLVGAGIYAGSGGSGTTLQNLSASYGPSFFACEMPTSTTPPAVLQSDGLTWGGGHVLQITECLYYPNSTGDLHLAPRPQFFNETGAPAPFYDATGTPTTSATDSAGNPISAWAQVDDVNFFLWINDPASGFDGILYGGRRAASKSTVWYGLSPDSNAGASQPWTDPISVAHGYHATAWESMAGFYSRNDIAKIVTGQQQSWQAAPLETFSLDSIAGFALQGIGAGPAAGCRHPSLPLVFFTLHGYERSGIYTLPAIAKWEIVPVGAA